MQSLTILLSVVVAASAVSFSRLVNEEWKTFKLQHKKQYSTKEEDLYRMKVYVNNKYMIAQHNQRFERGQESYSLKMNKYGDMSHQEFVHAMNGYNMTQRSPASEGVDEQKFPGAANDSLPYSIDWGDYGAVTAVKDQYNCRACWAFSATGALEGQHFRKTNRLVSLSEQNLIDCSLAQGNSGCEAGNMDNAFNYVLTNRGIDSENAYPYEAIDNKCRYDPKKNAADDKGILKIKERSEQQLKLVVAYYGPVSAAMDASPKSFQFYENGIYYDNVCSSKRLNHGVLVVGYGTDENNVDYWLVKNSWGTKWGEEGYFRLARNRRNHCGIATRASLPLPPKFHWSRSGKEAIALLECLTNLTD